MILDTTLYKKVCGHRKGYLLLFPEVNKSPIVYLKCFRAYLVTIFKALTPTFYGWNVKWPKIKYEVINNAVCLAFSQLSFLVGSSFFDQKLINHRWPLKVWEQQVVNIAGTFLKNDSMYVHGFALKVAKSQMFP